MLNLNTRQIKLIQSACVILLVFIAYFNSLTGEFIYDDLLLIQNNTYIRKPSYLPQIFTKELGAGSSSKLDFYRPLQNVSYMADYSFWKLKPAGYHFTNILLHALTALAVFWFVGLLFPPGQLPLLASILFAAHPLHTEAVSYIAARADLLSALFILLAFIFYIKQADSGGRKFYLLMLLSYGLSLLSKEYSLIFPAFILLFHYSFGKELKIKKLAPILAVSLLYLALRYAALGKLGYSPGVSSTFFGRLPGFFAAITAYFTLLIAPFDLHMEHGFKLFSAHDPKVWAGVLIFLASLIYAFKKRKEDKLIFFAVMFFWAAVSPVSNLFPINAYMAEHWLYLPSIGFFLILSRALTLLYAIKNLRFTAFILTALLLVFNSVLTIRQNNYWKDPLVFYKRTLKYSPANQRIYNNLGVLYYTMGDIKQAEACFRKILEINPGSAEAYNSLGNLYYETADKEKAPALFYKAIELKPDYVPAYFNLADFYFDAGRRSEAIRLYTKIIEINPKFIDAYYRLAEVYKADSDKGQVMALYKKAIDNNLDYFDAYYYTADLYSDEGMDNKAVTLFKRALKIEPDNAKAYTGLGKSYCVTGLLRQAIISLKKALALDPKLASAYNILAVAYFYEKDYSSAVKYCEEAVKLGCKVDAGFLKLLEPYRR